MKNSPTPSHDLITQALKLINQGFSVHRCSIKKGVITFENTQVQGLHSAVTEFKKLPSPETFENIKNALAKCKENDISSFNYAEIEEACDALTPSPTATSTKNKPF